MLPTQKHIPLLKVMLMQQTEFHQNQVATLRFPMEMETTVQWAPTGTAVMRMATKIALRKKKWSLNVCLLSGCNSNKMHLM